MKVFNTFSKGFKAVGSFGGAIADTIEGTIDLGTKAKNSLDKEVKSLQEERDMENAVSRILLRSEKIKEIMKALNISAAEADALLTKEMSK